MCIILVQFVHILHFWYVSSSSVTATIRLKTPAPLLNAATLVRAASPSGRYLVISVIWLAVFLSIISRKEELADAAKPVETGSSTWIFKQNWTQIKASSSWSCVSKKRKKRYVQFWHPSLICAGFVIGATESWQLCRDDSQLQRLDPQSQAEPEDARGLAVLPLPGPTHCWLPAGTLGQASRCHCWWDVFR